ncbi:hemerythrin domain-containing protein [Streptomyces flavotricini]|uniref:Hemerythrin domain-containing protein n=1 Tax=Streptomyces flavotricini TaxID=66888 RepID=A0ABS8EFM5_9ACTN|nr:hemerythrin domain-containing protein [Streptomyces flavotricini]MCC0099858.1 hemerythrin domain-containing protein [Streptomyces flavotricini]
MDREHVAPARPYGQAAADLTRVRVAHRAILADIERLAGLLAALAAAAEPAEPARAEAIAGYVHRYNDVVRGHHREDEILWPVVLDAVPDAAEAMAGIVRFIADHEALDALRADCDAVAARFAAEPDRHAGRLAGLLAAQRDLLAAHLEAEEEHVLPVIAGQVPAAAYAAAQARIRGADRSADPAWSRAWLLSHATEEEARRLLPAGAGPPAVLEPQLRAYAAEASAVFAG